MVIRVNFVRIRKSDKRCEEMKQMAEHGLIIKSTEKAVNN